MKPISNTRVYKDVLTESYLRRGVLGIRTQPLLLQAFDTIMLNVVILYVITKIQ